MQCVENKQYCEINIQGSFDKRWELLSKELAIRIIVYSFIFFKETNNGRSFGRLST